MPQHGVGDARGAMLPKQPDLANASVLRELLHTKNGEIASVSSQLRKLVEIDVEVAGYINDQGKIVLDNFGNASSVKFSKDIVNVSRVLFHTHPDAMCSRDIYFMPTDKDMYEILRQFFEGDQHSRNNLIVSDFGTINVHITSSGVHRKVDSDIIPHVIEQIEQFSAQAYDQTWIKIIGDTGRLDHVETGLLAAEQYRVLTRHGVWFNNNIKTALQEFSWLAHITLTCTMMFDFTQGTEKGVAKIGQAKK